MTKALSSPFLDKPIVKIVAVSCGIVMAILYVVQINMTATKGYEIRELEASLASLQHQSRVLRLQSLELQSMERLETQMQVQTAGLVAARPDAFVSAGGTVVASAR